MNWKQFCLLMKLFSPLQMGLLFAQSDNQDNFAKFREAMNGVRFEGYFTVDGSQKPPVQEVYEIHEVRKFGEGDLWIFTARIKYGKKEVTLPMPLPVKWIGELPVISMRNLSIPGLGVFSAHVVIDEGKYAGTWGHGNAGGHLYGKITRISENK